jgi:MOSC domain-containing protein YiiM
MRAGAQKTPTGPLAIGCIRSIQVGRIASLGPDGVQSAFVKKPVLGPVTVESLGILGDEQADLRVHGGPSKAIYGYAFSNYSLWRTEFVQYASLLVPGAFGENLTLDGCDEHTVCVGDIVKVGEAVLQVTQPRQPCYKFALRFADLAMPRAMIRNGLCGWYYRVLQTGVIDSGQQMLLDARPYPEWSIWQVNRLVIQRGGSVAEREKFAPIAAELLSRDRFLSERLDVIPD